MYKFESNHAAHNVEHAQSQLWLFTGVIVMLGFGGFWLIPGLVEGVIPRTWESVYGNGCYTGTVFFAV